MNERLIVGDKDGRPVNIDVAVEGEDGTVGGYGGCTLDELSMEYDNVRVMDIDDFIKLSDDYWRKPPRKVSQYDFMTALTTLPPEGWVRDSRGETFKMSEYTCGTITNIYAHYDGSYWCMADKSSMTHDEILCAIEATIQESFGIDTTRS